MSRLELLFNFLVGQRIARISFGIIQLLVQLAAIARVNRYHETVFFIMVSLAAVTPG